MATVASSSSSKGTFPFSHGTLKFDEYISNISCYYSSPTVIDDCNNTTKSTTFRTNTLFANDPELYMGDDCDTHYESMLMNSELINLLNTDFDGFSKTNQDLNVNVFAKHKAQKRLEMLLAHVNTTFLNPSNHKGKGKEK
ncbi:hypothetical protein BDF21DRAFT_422900 [Thamnidium elegans]|uniref:Uncharacterized protein n=1 Tax=Thamnidium elegans TaxID=101142 RepID=A0A8H7SIS7_9FUNG|nr:hypothetical protein INT48_004212 [Thamnidium elegans]KAI8076257.1 hypothetical protein BDF21DRAFT_422900 [Thamnidium elegans]